MALEPVYETINFNCKKCELKEQIKVECGAVSSEDVSSVLSVSAWANVNETEAKDGQINYSGRATFFISYLSTDGQIKKTECGSEFRGTIKDERITESAKVYADAVIDKAETDTSGVKLVAKAFVTVSVEISDCTPYRALSGGDNLILNAGETPVIRSYSAKKTVYPIEEQYELPYAVSEVLSHGAHAVITAVQCGVSSIIVDGEVITSAIALQKSSQNDIIKENRNFAFRAELECEDAMPSMTATARVKEKAFKIDVAVDEENGKSAVTVSVTLVFDGEAFSEEMVSVATDAFSTERELEVIKTELPYYKACDLRSVNCAVSGRAVISELPPSATILAVGGEKAELLSTVCGQGQTTITGVLSAVAYLRDGDGRVFTENIETPFESVIDCAFSCDTELSVRLKATRGRAKIVTLTEIELESEIIVTVYPTERQSVRLVGEIKAGKEKSAEKSGISVYIAQDGEEQWELAKRINVCPDEISRINPDLQFPLTGKERIIIYRQK